MYYQFTFQRYSDDDDDGDDDKSDYVTSWWTRCLRTKPLDASGTENEKVAVEDDVMELTLRSLQLVSNRRWTVERSTYRAAIGSGARRQATQAPRSSRESRPKLIPSPSCLHPLISLHLFHLYLSCHLTTSLRHTAFHWLREANVIELIGLWLVDRTFKPIFEMMVFTRK